MSVLETLTKARDLLSEPNKWIKGTFALNDCGAICDPNSPHARQFCMLGAIRASTALGGGLGGAYARLEEAITNTNPRITGNRVPTFNDHALTTHQDVLNAFSVAIAAELNRENKS